MEAWHQYTLLLQKCLTTAIVAPQVMAFKVTLKTPNGEETIECPGERLPSSPGSSSEAWGTLAV